LKGQTPSHGFVLVGDEEYKVECETSVVVPPRTIHCFGLRGGGILRAMAVLPDADAVLGHRLFEIGEETCDLPSVKK